MIIRFNDDLSKEYVFANGNELANIMGYDILKGRRVYSYKEDKKVQVHIFKNPVLVTDNYQISKLKPSLRDTLFSLFSSKLRIVEYDKVTVKDDGRHPNVWSPSIDTLLFAKAIKKSVLTKKMKSAIEIGCGSGFLSKYLLTKSKKLKSMLINDINPEAIKFAMENINDSRAIFYSGNGINKLKQNKYDLIICNPPYIPRPKSIDDNPYEGVSLLYDLVHNGQNYLNKNGILITNVSSLAWNIIFKKKPKMKVKLLARLEVPLKVNNVMNNKDWINYLIKNKLVKSRFKDGYSYWHVLNIVALYNKA